MSMILCMQAACHADLRPLCGLKAGPHYQCSRPVTLVFTARQKRQLWSRAVNTGRVYRPLRPIQTTLGTVSVRNSYIRMIPHDTLRHFSTLRTHAYRQSFRECPQMSGSMTFHVKHTGLYCAEPYGSARTTADLRQKVCNCRHYSRPDQFLWTAVYRTARCRAYCEDSNILHVLE